MYIITLGAVGIPLLLAGLHFNTGGPQWLGYAMLITGFVMQILRWINPKNRS